MVQLAKSKEDRVAPRYKQNRQLIFDRQHLLAGYSLDGFPVNYISDLSGSIEAPHYAVDLLPAFLFNTVDGLPVIVDSLAIDTEAAEVPADVGMYGVIEYLWTLTPYGRSDVINYLADSMTGRLHCRVSRGTCQGIELVPQTHLWSSQVQLYPEILVTSTPQVNTFTLQLQVDSVITLPLVFGAVRTAFIRVASPNWGYGEP